MENNKIFSFRLRQAQSPPQKKSVRAWMSQKTSSRYNLCLLRQSLHQSPLKKWRTKVQNILYSTKSRTLSMCIQDKKPSTAFSANQRFQREQNKNQTVFHEERTRTSSGTLEAANWVRQSLREVSSESPRQQRYPSSPWSVWKAVVLMLTTWVNFYPTNPFLIMFCCFIYLFIYL